MRIAIYGKVFKADQKPYIRNLIQLLEEKKVGICIHHKYLKRIEKSIKFKTEPKAFSTHQEIRNVDFLFSIGGDGTLLDTLAFIRDSGIPILGINLGRMGFISSIYTHQIKEVIHKLFNNQYTLDKRSLLRLETENNLFGDLNYALNDISIYRKNPFSMLTIEAYVNNKFLNAYWGDGLIIATPTGSTGYSLSCGGPIILPGSQNFVITPIATHNLTVRPIVIPDDSHIKIRITGRVKKFYVNLDSHSESVDSSIELNIRSENFKVNLVKPEGEDFLKTIHEKLNWGLDVRN
jgi:NAD+ kinase